MGSKNTKFVLSRSLWQGASSQKVSKIRKFIAFTVACPKTQKAVLASLVL
jgi:hypothetical protein